MRVLYISYDGANDPLGRSQVVPYVEGLARLGHDITLLSFEKKAGPAPRGVRWIPLRYHPGSRFTAADLAHGFARVSLLPRFDLVHARSYPGCLIAWWMHKAFGTPYIFDIRGFYPEERVDGGLWPKDGLLFRVTKRLEASFDRSASAIVTLTHASVPVLAQRTKTPVTVIPTCVDLDRFVRTAGPRNPFELVYLGSLGTWYLTREMIDFARVAQRLDPTCVVRFITNDAPPACDLDPLRTFFESVASHDVPRALSSASATFFFILPAFSKIASAATKFGETLAMGLPAAINAGVGDSAQLVRQHGVGTVLDAFSPSAYEKAFVTLRELATEPGIEQRCRSLAEDVFSLRRGIAAYDALYASIGAVKPRD